MSGEIVYILATARSGSTLLAQLLGAHSKICVAGELHWLRAFVHDDHSIYNPPHELICACGSRFIDCEFWQAVADKVSKPMSEFDLIPWPFRLRLPDRKGPVIQRVARRIAEIYPSVYRSRLVQRLYGSVRISKESIEIFDAIAAHTRVPYIVDSSKSAYRFRSLYDSYPEKLKAIVLQRDYRAVAYSQLKRGISIEDSARKWAQSAHSVETLSKNIPAEKFLRLRYEDLCERPEAELRRICSFLGIEFEDTMLSRPSDGIHDLGGSPSKFQSGRSEIRLDSEYLDVFSQTELDTMCRLAGPAAEQYGYT